MEDANNEVTAWQDINPPMVSAQQRERPSTSSADEARTVFRNELTACLALTAPVGMTEEARRDWLAVAWQTLKDVPPHILAIGAKAARQKCDHPSKIVPTIMAETADMRSWAKLTTRESSDPETLRLKGPDYCTPEEAAAILEQFGLRRRPTAHEEEAGN